MKKLILLLAFLVSLGSALAQDNLFKRLDNTKAVGGYCFGDSITHYLTRLTPVSINEGGNIEAKVDDDSRSAFNVGAFIPSRVHLVAEGYKIYLASLWFGNYARVRLYELLCQYLGAPTYRDGAYFWGSTHFTVCYSLDDPETPNIIIADNNN